MNAAYLIAAAAVLISLIIGGMGLAVHLKMESEVSKWLLAASALMMFAALMLAVLGLDIQYPGVVSD